MSLPDTSATIEHPSVLTDIEFVTALHAAADASCDIIIDGDAPDWPIPTNTAQALAVADLYGVDGDCAADCVDPETYTDLHALCILAHAYRQATASPCRPDRRHRPFPPQPQRGPAVKGTTMKSISSPVLVTRVALAAIAGVSIASVDRRIKEGAIPVIRIGTRVLIDPDAALEALRQRSTPAVDDAALVEPIARAPRPRRSGRRPDPVPRRLPRPGGDAA